jgi:hypothetical protein
VVSYVCSFQIYIFPYILGIFAIGKRPDRDRDRLILSVKITQMNDYIQKFKCILFFYAKYGRTEPVLLFNKKICLDSVIS